MSIYVIIQYNSFCSNKKQKEKNFHENTILNKRKKKERPIRYKHDEYIKKGAENMKNEQNTHTGRQKKEWQKQNNRKMATLAIIHILIDSAFQDCN